ncbi:MAG TPA: multicopper oxidase domain-containing protein, partial [Ilumatobacter sp.]|nr:multicopper oxidase domain-containing protein [Ilumatobacter sp.]
MTDVELRSDSDPTGDNLHEGALDTVHDTDSDTHSGTGRAEPKRNSDSLFLAFFAFLLAGAAVVFAGYALFTSDGGGSAAAAPGGEQVVVEISLTEFAITPAMPTVPAGSNVTIRVTNNGSMVHNLVFTESGESSGDLQPGETSTIELRNVSAGDMDFICTIVGHEGSGMVGMLMVVDGEVPAGDAADDLHADMTWQEMDAAMEERALRFVEEEKGVFGGQPLAPEILADGTKRFELTASIVDWETEPGKIVKAWTYNGMVPGPQMQVDVGDKVEIVLHNELPESTTIHMHGVLVPNSMDGVDPYNQSPIHPGDSFTYAFTAREPAVGMYHSHHNAQVQVPNGLAGAFLIGEMPIPEQLIEKGFTQVDQQVTMVLNDAGTIGLTLNGKSFPATEAYTAKVGETMLVHYYNEGLMPHPMHMHQPTGWIIAKDGVPLDVPMPSDTINVAPGER